MPYDKIFGGVTALSVAHIRMVNGFSNVFFGWGGEDDDMFNRLCSYEHSNISKFLLLSLSVSAVADAVFDKQSLCATGMFLAKSQRCLVIRSKLSLNVYLWLFLHNSRGGGGKLCHFLLQSTL